MKETCETKGAPRRQEYSDPFWRIERKRRESMGVYGEDKIRERGESQREWRFKCRTRPDDVVIDKKVTRTGSAHWHLTRR